jgi:hypothetical protein
LAPAQGQHLAARPQARQEYGVATRVRPERPEKVVPVSNCSLRGCERLVGHKEGREA